MGGAAGWQSGTASPFWEKHWSGTLAERRGQDQPAADVTSGAWPNQAECMADQAEWGPIRLNAGSIRLKAWPRSRTRSSAR